MNTPVIALRFVNTPTVGELYEEEAKGQDLGVEEEHVNDLSDEYNQVSGNEAYYQLMFKYLPEPHRDLNRINGSEGLVSWVKDAVSSLIEQVKRFFKWVFSFFTSKQKITENKLEGFELDLDKHGIKSGSITYPEGTVALWGNDASLPNNLNWVDDAMKRVKANIKKANAFVDQIERFATSGTEFLMPSKVNEEGFKKHVEGFRKAIGHIFTSGDHPNKPVYFEGGMDIVVGQKGNVKFQPNQKVLKKRNPATFSTNLTQVKELHKTVEEVSNIDLRNLINNITNLETLFIKTLESTMHFAEQVSLGEREVEMKKVVKHASAFITESMASLKAIETICYRSTNSALTLLGSCINKG